MSTPALQREKDTATESVALVAGASPGPSVQVCGFSVYGFDSVESCADRILESIGSGVGGFAVAFNAEKAILATESQSIGALVRQATLVYPDGAGVVLAMRRKGFSTSRVPGVDLWREVLRRSVGKSIRVAVIGSTLTVIADAAQRIRFEYPNARIVVELDGYSGVRDLDAVAQQLRDAEAGLVLVAMGSPRQEEAIVRMRAHYPTGHYLGLGGSFDVYTGRKKRAPRWMQGIGLEWAYRFVSEPSRARREVTRFRFLLLLLAGRT